MTLKRCFLFIAFCSIPTSLFSNKLYFPQVAFGGGYTTTIVLMNMGLTSVSSDFQVYGQTGALLRSIPTTVPGGGSTRLSIADPGQSIISSWGMLDGGAGTVQGIATIDLRSTNGALITTVAVSGLEAGDGFRLPVDVTGDGIAVNTAIAMANVNPSNRITVVLVLMPESGSSSVTGSDERFITLDSGHQIAEFVTSIWPQLAVGFRGTLSVAIVDFGRHDSLVLTALSVKDGLLSALPVIPDNSCFGCWDY
jgi:hypothetical protein